MNLSRLLSEIDVEATLDRLCGDAELLLEILDMFLIEFRDEHPALLLNAQESNFTWVAAKAHYFKGIAQNLGLLRFLMEIRLLEQSAKLSDKAMCLQALNSLMEITHHIQALRNDMQQA